MRKEFIYNLIKYNKKKNIFLVVNDLGFNVVEPFKKKFPKNFYNAGVSEQNMMGLAAGLASEKAQVFVYSIANFSTFRCAEQIRNDVDYHNLPVTIVSVGSGLGYGNLGYSHFALQDYALMRLFPNMLILSPGNLDELYKIIKFITNKPLTSYLRLDKDKPSSDYTIRDKQIVPGKIYKLKHGIKEKVILTTGNVQNIAEKINKNNHSIYSLPIWGMKTKKITQNYLKNFKQILTIEDHFEDGGFGSWVRECMKNPNIKIITKSINSDVLKTVGSKRYLLNKFGPRI